MTTVRMYDDSNTKSKSLDITKSIQVKPDPFAPAVNMDRR